MLCDNSDHCILLLLMIGFCSWENCRAKYQCTCTMFSISIETVIALTLSVTNHVVACRINMATTVVRLTLVDIWVMETDWYLETVLFLILSGWSNHFSKNFQPSFLSNLGHHVEKISASHRISNHIVCLFRLLSSFMRYKCQLQGDSVTEHQWFFLI